MKSKQILEIPLTHLLVFDTGDEIVDVLTTFARDTRVVAASFQAIGAFQRATLAYWNPETRVYEDLPVGEQVEVVSLIGNVTRDERGQPRVHAHASLGKRDGSLIGGHLKNGVVLPTLELVLTRSDVAVRRRIDEETRLPLIDLQ